MNSPSYVLLDQKDWIGIARWQKHGDSDYQAVAELLQEHQSNLVPVVSHERYVETLGSGKAGWRRDVAEVVASYSGFQSIAPVDALMAYEAMRVVASLAPSVRLPELAIFGLGVSHALGQSSEFEFLGSVVSYGPEMIRSLREAGWRLGEPDLWLETETDVLAAAELSEHLSMKLSLDKSEFCDAENKLEADHLVAGVISPESQLGVQAYFAAATRLVELPAMTTLDIIQAEEVAKALSTIDHQEAVDRCSELPTLRVLRELRSQKIQNAQRKWREGDKADVNSLRHGIPYCDVVSTDKYWSDLANRTQLPDEFGSAVVGTVPELEVALRNVINSKVVSK